MYRTEYFIHPSTTHALYAVTQRAGDAAPAIIQRIPLQQPVGWGVLSLNSIMDIPAGVVPYLVPLAEDAVFRTARITALRARLTMRQSITNSCLCAAPARPLSWQCRVSNPRAVRKIMREFGTLVAAVMSGGADDMDEAPNAADLLDRLPHLAPTNEMASAWNGVVCAAAELHACDHCGVFAVRDDMHDVGVDENEGVCGSCFDSEFVAATDQHGDTYYVHHNNAYEHSDGEMYTYEEEVEDEYDDDDEQLSGLRSYSSNVLHVCERDAAIVSSCYGDFTLGIELEVEAERRITARACVDHTSSTLCPDYAILKRDGSLNSAKGFEIVTAPRGLDEHIRRFKAWEPHNDLRSWDTEACGMHVHIDARAFTALTLAKFLVLINNASEDGFIKAIAGRSPGTDSNMRQYANRPPHAGAADIKALPMLKGMTANRYTMVNLANLTEGGARRLGVANPENYSGRYNTIELRIFRGTLNKARLLAQFEFAHAAVMYCRTASLANVSGRDFLAWLGTTGAVLYPHLARWFGVRAAKKPIAPEAAAALITHARVLATAEEV